MLYSVPYPKQENEWLLLIHNLILEQCWTASSKLISDKTNDVEEPSQSPRDLPWRLFQTATAPACKASPGSCQGQSQAWGRQPDPEAGGAPDSTASVRCLLIVLHVWGWGFRKEFLPQQRSPSMMVWNIRPAPGALQSPGSCEVPPELTRAEGQSRSPIVRISMHWFCGSCKLEAELVVDTVVLFK